MEKRLGPRCLPHAGFEVCIVSFGLLDIGSSPSYESECVRERSTRHAHGPDDVDQKHDAGFVRVIVDLMFKRVVEHHTFAVLPMK